MKEFIFASLILGWELYWSFDRKNQRRKTWVLAKKRALQTCKKLLVIGDPDNGFFNTITGRDYGHGDVCIDLNGCPKADTSVKVYSENVETVLPKLNLNEYIIFQSCVFEYVNNFDAVRRSLESVPIENLFFVNVEPWCVAAYIYPGFLTGDYSVPKRVLYAYPPHNKYVGYFENDFAKKLVTAIILGAAFIGAMRLYF